MAVLRELKAQLLDPNIIEEAVTQAVAELTAPHDEGLSGMALRIEALTGRLRDWPKPWQRGRHPCPGSRTPDEGGGEAATSGAISGGANAHPDLWTSSRFGRAFGKQCVSRRRTLTSHTEQARIMVQTLMDGRAVSQPQRDDDGEFYEFSASKHWCG